MIRLSIGLGRSSSKDDFRIGPVQEAVLRTVRDHPSEADSISIANHLRKSTEIDIANSQALVALRRLEARGLVAELSDTAIETADRDGRPSRVGRPRLMFRITKLGRRVLGAASGDDLKPNQREGDANADVAEASEGPHPLGA